MHRYPDLLIFDCDGVLIDSELISCKIAAEHLNEIGIPISTEDFIARYMGRSDASEYADMEARFGPALVAKAKETAWRKQKRREAAFEKELQAIPEIRETVASLRCPYCVASSSSPERLLHSLSLVDLYQVFAPHIFSATQVANGKPAPDLFLFAAKQMGVAPENCLVVEDSFAGVEAAVAAGMRVFGFTGGSHCRDGHAEKLRALGAEQIFAKARDLIDLLGAPEAHAALQKRHA